MPYNSVDTGIEPSKARQHPLIVQSHLRWDFVWQRPQQLLSRLASSAPVLFVEEPIYLDDASADHLDITEPNAGIYRALPKLRSELRDSYDISMARVRELVLMKIASHPGMERMFSNAVQWFYTPMPAPAMLGAFNEIGVVYDCMDELAQFRNAPPDLLRRERLLMSNADVVFTGGYQLYKNKSALHSNVHFFGCGVDVEHFGAARHSKTEIPGDAMVPSPVAGYFGVIDERLDYDLIQALAASRPDLTILMVGPTAKVNPEELPHSHNIHWLGQRSYEDLPRYVKAFDVCLMPFAINEATEYINPTKTLEYMAAGKPIVSTAVADVVRNFTPTVRVAKTHADFIKAVVEDADHVDPTRIADGIEMASHSSWESIVTRMRTLITKAVDESAILDDVDSVTGVSNSNEAQLPGV